MAVKFTPATEADIAELMVKLRPADRAEMEALAGPRALPLLQSSIAYGENYAGHWDGELACVFGIHRLSILPSVGQPWLLTTEVVAQHAKVFMEQSKRFVEDWQERFDTLVNYVDARYSAAIAWLKWLGFEIEPAEPHGIFGMPFHRAVRTGWHGETRPGLARQGDAN